MSVSPPSHALEPTLDWQGGGLPVAWAWGFVALTGTRAGRDGVSVVMREGIRWGEDGRRAMASNCRIDSTDIYAMTGK